MTDRAELNRLADELVSFAKWRIPDPRDMENQAVRDELRQFQSDALNAASLLRSCAERERDGERYRWLRDRPSIRDLKPAEPLWLVMHESFDEAHFLRRAQLDYAIDAAMASQTTAPAQAGQERRSAPSQEGHAAGPAHGAIPIEPLPERVKETLRLLERYANALGTAWTNDCRESVSDRKLREVWDKAQAARAELEKSITDLARLAAECERNKEK